MPTSPPDQSTTRRPHPLALELAERLRGRAGARVIELGTGSARNTAALLDTGLTVISVDDDPQRTFRARTLLRARPDLTLETSAYTQLPGRQYAAALSTHGLLHGSFDKIHAIVAETGRVLAPEGLLYVTFGSKRDARFGAGHRVDADTFAPNDGDEQGVPHAFFSESQVRGLLGFFAVESLEERTVDEIAGSWAHQNAPLSGGVHWFVRAVKKR